MGVGCVPYVGKFVKMVKMVCAYGSGVWAVYLVKIVATEQDRGKDMGRESGSSDV